jgi:hypothetical protein
LLLLQHLCGHALSVQAEAYLLLLLLLYPRLLPLAAGSHLLLSLYPYHPNQQQQRYLHLRLHCTADSLHCQALCYFQQQRLGP